MNIASNVSLLLTIDKDYTFLIGSISPVRIADLNMKQTASRSLTLIKSM